MHLPESSSLQDDVVASSMVGIAAMRTWIEPVVAGSQVASAFYDTALLPPMPWKMLSRRLYLIFTSSTT